MYYCSDVDIYHLYGTLLVLAHTFISSRETRQCMYVGSIPYAGYHRVALEVNSWFPFTSQVVAI